MKQQGITCNQISFAWRDRTGNTHRVFENLGLSIQPHEFIAIVGHSGVGKTTLLHLLGGIQKPTNGEVLFHGAPLPGPNKNLGMVFQDYSLFPWLTAEQNVAFGLTLAHIPPDSKKKKVTHILERVGLADVATKYPHELSGGMRQRIAIARALANNSDYILMDEPFGALDHATRSDMQHLLLQVWQEFAKTIIFVTHNIEEAVFLADRILVMRQGGELHDMPINLPRPRHMLQPEFIDARGQILQLLKK